MKITYQPTYTRIPVGIEINYYKVGESYRDQMARIRLIEYKIDHHYIKQLQPKWYKKAMEIKRNQVVTTTPNEFIKEMN